VTSRARVSEIRPVERTDLPQVAELYERTVRSGRPTPPRGLASYFERTLLDHPWVDPDIPSLVFDSGDGHILGFQGAHVRRVRLDDRQIRMACGSNLFTDPRTRQLGIGARLLRSHLSGPQDLTITDGATAVVHEMWVRLGGYALHPGSVVWTRVFRPFRAVGDLWLEVKGKARLRTIARPAWALLDAPMTCIARPPERPAGVETDDLTPRALVHHQRDVDGIARLRVDYDETFVEWLFREMSAVRTRGTLVRRLLRRGDRLLGWYVAYLKPRGLSQVMDVKATRGQLGTVLDCLFADAWQSGAGALEGRMEPALYESLSGRRCLLRYGERSLFHSRDPEVLAAISLGRSALTRLDGEWWMGHHTETFE
jgi:GNAT superfamily N-acetyltransferase